MMPNQKLRVIVSNDMGLSSEFGISRKDESHIMGILRDTLYSDKVLAVIREYSSNAWDAHRDAGIPGVPIKVTMPTRMDPTLSIRDFGKGLSQSDVFEIYTQYGASTKRESDNSVGMLGIGSKSGFAYSDSFTIISHHNGMKRTYVAVLDESEKGMINQLAEEPSDETGVEIKIAVRHEDIWEFESKAREFFMYFKPRPDINIELPNLPTSQNNLTSGAIYNASGEDEYRTEKWVAIMGCVPYRINLDQLRDVEVNGAVGIPQFLNDISGALYFNIGDVQINASREELKYSTETKKNLVEKLNLLVEEYVSATLADIQKAEVTQWERRIRAQVLKKLGLPVVETYKDLVSGFVKFEPDTVPKTIYIYRGKEAAHTIQINQHTRILLRDDTRAIGGFKLKEYDYVVRKTDRKNTWDFIKTEVDAMCAKLGLEGIPVLNMSTLPWEQPRHGSGGRTINPKHRQRVFRLVDTNADKRLASSNWEPESRVPTEDDVFVLISEFRSIGVDVVYEYRQDARLAESFGVKMPPVYGYKTTPKKPVDAANCLGKSYSAWRTAFAESLVTPDTRKAFEYWGWSRVIAEDDTYDYDHRDRQKRTNNYKKIINELGRTHPISKFIVQKLQGKKALKKLSKQDFPEILERLRRRVPNLVGELEAEKAKEALDTLYPLLGEISLLWCGGNAPHWIKYVKAIDEYSKTRSS